MHTENRPQIISNSTMPAPDRLASLSIAKSKELKDGTKLDEEQQIVRTATNICSMNQQIVDNNLTKLVAFRTDSDVMESSVQDNIRHHENKIVRSISQQIVARGRIPNWREIPELRRYPDLTKWLTAVGLNDECQEIIMDKFKDIEELLAATDEELIRIISDGFFLEDFKSNSDDGDSSPTQSLDMEIKYEDKKDIRTYVHDYLQRLLKAQKCLRLCMNSSLSGKEIAPDVKIHWDSWDHWLNQRKKKPTSLSNSETTVEELASPKVSPRPLPPLPSFSQSRLSNRSNCDNGSKSTGSSPLSPPAPPLSAGNNRSALSASSSSSSINPAGFYNFKSNSNVIVDPNHAPPMSRRPTPPPTPPVLHHKKSFILSSSSIFSFRSDRKFPTTPPPIRRHQTTLFSSEQFPLTKSKSHEEHLSNRIEPLDPVIATKFVKKYNLSLFSGKKSSNHKQHISLDNLPNVPQQQRRRLATEPGSIGSTSPILTSSNCSSPLAISPDNQTLSEKAGSGSDAFQDPSTPRSPGSQGMYHHIHHRFTPTMKFSSNICNVCDKPMIFGNRCKFCKYLCHWDCQQKAANSCGLPMEFFDVFKQTLSEIELKNLGIISPAASHKSLSSSSFSHHRAKSNLSNYPITTSQSTSNPSSPALFNPRSSASSVAVSPTTSAKSNSQFQFPPDINITYSPLVPSQDETQPSSHHASSHSIIIDEPPPEPEEEPYDEELNNIPLISQEDLQEHLHKYFEKPVMESEKSGNSVATSGSSGDSVRTITARLDSQDSQASELDQNERVWPRQNSLMNREWDIPFNELSLGEKIGTGRFGTVFRGYWHGSVAIKRLNMDSKAVSPEERKALDTFKQEVANFRKTRHENLILFMGACLKSPHYAIVTSLLKGLPLHTHIHERHDKFNLNRLVMICEQICQGMGYLHSRGIIHKDLKTKNIFYESGRVIITDFGLSSVAKLCETNRRGDRLTVPKGWLCYLAPEIIRTLCVHSSESDDLPFSPKTDVYAFGTVLYELLFGNWPFAGQSSEVIIWQVGKGIKQPINNFQSGKEIKDILSWCWSYNPRERPEFVRTLSDTLQRLPKKKLQRSPSHPAQLQHTTVEQKF